MNRAYETGRTAAERRASDFGEEMQGRSKAEDGERSADADRAPDDEPSAVSLSGPETHASWMDSHESETLERARTAGRRRAESEASEEPVERPPTSAGG